MTMVEVSAGLSILVGRLANDDDDPPPNYSPEEWAYVKGIASAVVLSLIDRLAPALDR